MKYIIRVFMILSLLFYGSYSFAELVNYSLGVKVVTTKSSFHINQCEYRGCTLYFSENDKNQQCQDGAYDFGVSTDINNRPSSDPGQGSAGPQTFGGSQKYYTQCKFSLNAYIMEQKNGYFPKMANEQIVIPLSDGKTCSFWVRFVLGSFLAGKSSVYNLSCDSGHTISSGSGNCPGPSADFCLEIK